MAYLISFIFSICLVNAAQANYQNEVLLHQNKPVQSIDLTGDEKLWLSTHKSIRIAFDGSMPPYSFINESGEYEGIAVDIINVLSRNLGIEFKTYPNSQWADIYKAAIERNIDVIATMVDRQDRHLWFNFTQPYLTKSLVIIARNDNATFKNRSDLAGKRVALPKGYHYRDQVIQEFPSIKPYFVNTMLDGLKLVSRGKVDATIAFMATMNYLQSKHHLNNLVFVDFYDRNSADESIAVRKDWPKLSGILQKGLDSLSEAEINAIFSKWVTPSDRKPAKASTLPENKPAVEKQELTPRKTRFFLNWKVPTPIWLMLIVLLLWIFQIKRQNDKIKRSKNELQASLNELNGLRENLEQLVLRRTAQLKASELKFRNLVENQGNEYFFYQHDCNGDFTYISPSITNILGYSVEEFMRHYRDYLTDNPINQKVQEYIELAIKGIPNRPYHIEINDNMKKLHWLEVTDSPVYDDYGNCIGVDGVMHEITARKKTDEHLIKLSYYDDITGLANRRLFIDRLQHTITMSQRKRLQFSLLFLDIDHFKEVNDAVGHTAGDKVLKEAAGRILSVLRDSDIAARYGSDEFVLLLPETPKEAAVHVAEKVLKALRDPYLLNEKKVNLGLSIGIATYPEDGALCEDLISRADSAMYLAKKKQSGLAGAVQITE